MQNDDDTHQSLDDALEDRRRDSIFRPQSDEEKLAEDNDTPAAPADDVPSSGPQDEPADDDGTDPDEAYQEGRAQAVDNANQTVEQRDQPQPLEPEDDEA